MFIARGRDPPSAARKDAQHQRQVAGAVMDDAEQSLGRRLTLGDGAQVAHGLLSAIVASCGVGRL